MHMRPDRKKVLKWEMFGILFIILFGSFLHFIFELGGQSKVIALIGAVNESVWEHLKIGFWPAFIWAFIEFFVYGKRTMNFLFAKGLSLTLIGLLITGIYYGSVALGIETFAVDAANFIITIIAVQIISYRLTLIQRYHKALNAIGVILIVANLAAFSIFSYYPPECPVFRDPVSGGYGIIAHVQ